MISIEEMFKKHRDVDRFKWTNNPLIEGADTSVYLLTY